MIAWYKKTFFYRRFRTIALVATLGELVFLGYLGTASGFVVNQTPSLAMGIYARDRDSRTRGMSGLLTFSG